MSSPPPKFAKADSALPLARSSSSSKRPRFGSRLPLKSSWTVSCARAQIALQRVRGEGILARVSFEGAPKRTGGTPQVCAPGVPPHCLAGRGAEGAREKLVTLQELREHSQRG